MTFKSYDLISKPVTGIHGDINIPGDKSISHRSIILGSIAQGTSIINGFLPGEDCQATLNAFRAMGVSIEQPEPKRVIIHGVGKYGLKAPAGTLDCGNSGTSMRLLTGLLAAQAFDSELTGDESLLKRPMLRVSKPLTQMGASISTQDGKPPVKIHGGSALEGIEYSMPVASAQVKSCLLLAGLYAQGTTKIVENGISRDHTERMLRTMGYPVTTKENTISIDSQSECRGTTIDVPGDISSAAFFIVAATIIPGSDVILRNIGFNPTRTGIIDILTRMGADIKVLSLKQSGDEPVADLQVKYAPLKGIEIPKSLVPLAIDEFPIIFIAAACADGVTTLRGAEELRAKESDRIGAMVEGLSLLGIDAQGFEDGIKIVGGVMKGGEVNSYGDHRIAMSFVIAGACAKDPVIVKNCANIATSFPTFVATAKSIQFDLGEVFHEL